ncbi:MAG: 2-amino-4-hydroxy-6-hydroxymethyldihydropteridine diphosphokinase [Microscillaceae bacterium]|nr:2-amino-4-hydroxy-6-hydroxymethyldihydropteridine diphosphokinase [Microscillaceae bacterium]MDW8461458.1 2-amino-4-hydroxy-6-hydroxymethyldihydropteridine diphosphokinase [Cytophagales bacterium]
MIFTLLLGTNLGDRLQNLQAACQYIYQEIGKIVQQSSIYETEPWGYTQQPTFYNQVLNVESELSPWEVLQKNQAIEQKLGRTIRNKWTARSMDIDILYAEGTVLETPNLIIPHPAIPFRRFTLVPLCEIMPHFLHPVLEQTQEYLLKNCADDLAVKRLNQ